VVVLLSLVVVVVTVNSSFSSPQEMIVRVKNVDRKRENIFFIFPSITKVK
jgi:hypothetical protein